LIFRRYCSHGDKGEDYLIENFNEKGMILKKPVIKDLPNDRVRLSCDIYDNGELKPLYFEVDKEYKQYLCHERSDAFIIQILPYAMLAGQDIYCETPVTETLLHNINEVLVPNLASGYDTKFKLIKIHADMDNTPLRGTEVSTGISLGVDSFYTIFETINSDYDDFKLTHLLNIRRPHAETKLSEHYNVIEETAAYLNLPTNFIITNVRNLWKSFHGLTHIYTNLGAAYALRKLINTYYYSTAYGLEKFSIERGHRSFPDNYLLLLAYCFTTPDFNVLMGGLEAHRHDKIIAISNQDIVQKNLRVCVARGSVFNCSMCEKCKRSLMEFDMLGVLDNYKNVFDVDYYLNNKVEYIKELHSQPGHVLVKPLLAYFNQKEPELVAQAEKLFSEDFENLSDADFKAEYGIRKKITFKNETEELKNELYLYKNRKVVKIADKLKSAFKKSI
jgi:hypothetical protein